MQIIIVGGGGIGLATANILSEEHKVTIVESDEKSAKSVANKTSALVVKGDGTDISTLKEAGIEHAEAIIVTSDDDKTNLMICEIAKTEKVKKIISIVNSPRDEELFAKLGITSFIPVVETLATAIRRSLSEYGEEKVIALEGGGELQIIQQIVSKSSSLAGKKAEIKNAIICSISRDNEIILPSKDTTIKEGDRLTVSVKTDNLSGVVDLISGK